MDRMDFADKLGKTTLSHSETSMVDPLNPNESQSVLGASPPLHLDVPTLNMSQQNLELMTTKTENLSGTNSHKSMASLIGKPIVKQ